MKRSGRPLPDLAATATALTAASIATAVRARGAETGDLIVSGGGSHNPVLMALLAAFLPGTAISISTDHGINADAKEAIAFAILARETWKGRSGNLPSATGASHPAVLGSITPGSGKMGVNHRKSASAAGAPTRGFTGSPTRMPFQS
jgi:anhydro-N-acetylmuramic acid kinase